MFKVQFYAVGQWFLSSEQVTFEFAVRAAKFCNEKNHMNYRVVKDGRVIFILQDDKVVWVKEGF